MVRQARLRADRAITAADETRREAIDRRAEDATDLGRLIVHLLDMQLRHSLDVVAAFGRMVAWEGIVRAQTELFGAGLGWWDRSGGESAPRPEQRRSTRPRGHSVGTVMKRRCPVLAQPDETVQAATERMTEAVCGSILVCNGDRLCGIFTERDLMIRVVGKGLDPRKTRLAEVMTRDPDRIESAETTHEALRRMDGFAHHDLPVVEDGRALGVISLQDLPSETFTGMLPELEQRRALAERMR